MTRYSTLQDDHDTFNLDLTAMAHGGSALGRHEGKTIFVPYAIPGERVKARVTRAKKGFAYAESVEIVQESPTRVVPRCKHFGTCGGCHWQHIDYAAQLEFKRQVVIDQLARVGGFRDVPVHPTVASPNPWMYRSHVSFHVTQEGGLGFVAADDRAVIPIDECPIIRPELREVLETFKSERLKPGERVRVQVGSESGERLVALGRDDDDAPQVVQGAECVHYVVKGHTFRVSAGSFFQVNLPQAEKLVDLVLDRLALQGSERVLDLYSGVGLFTAFLCPLAAQVTAVESFAPAVRDAEHNLAEFSNVELVTGTVEEVLNRLPTEYDAVGLDPPRTGMKPEALDTLIRLAPRKIVYVSCDPATLARDCKRLAGAGYRLIDVQPVDMFPQTFHIESVATLIK
jgi:23S rRNA (uracil1939-C5)-methyltransferase